MEAINEVSKAIAQSIEKLKFVAPEEFKNTYNRELEISEVINLLEVALDKLVDHM
jgi:hypothetical protein